MGLDAIQRIITVSKLLSLSYGTIYLVFDKAEEHDLLTEQREMLLLDYGQADEHTLHQGFSNVYGGLGFYCQRVLWVETSTMALIMK